MLKDLFFGTSNLKGFVPSLALLALRIFVGLSLAFAHGLGKTPPSEKFIGGLGQMGFPAPVFFAWSAGLAEFLGGILLACGLLTRPAAVSIAITMGVAAFIRHASDPFRLKELALVYFITATLFVFLGGGRWSIDRFIR